MLASQINFSYIDMHLLVGLLTTILFCLQAIQLQPVITVQTVHLQEFTIIVYNLIILYITSLIFIFTEYTYYINQRNL